MWLAMTEFVDDQVLRVRVMAAIMLHPKAIAAIVLINKKVNP